MVAAVIGDDKSLILFVEELIARKATEDEEKRKVGLPPNGLLLIGRLIHVLSRNAGLAWSSCCDGCPKVKFQSPSEKAW